MIRKYILILLRVLLGVTFIISGVTKFLSLESFELFVLHYKIFSWDLTVLAVRLLISFEIILGIFIIFRIYIKQMIITSFSVLMFFNTFLIWVLISGEIPENCNCFGEQFELSPLESLIKNFVLLFITIAVRKFEPFRFKFQRIIVGVFCVAVIATPIILDPPSFLHQLLYHETVEAEKLDLELIGDPIFSGERIDLSKGKLLLVLSTYECSHCKKAANKISLIHSRNAEKFPIYFISSGDINNAEAFWVESGATNRFPVKHLAVKRFIYLSKGRVPKVLLVENGIIIDSYFGMEIKESNIVKFFEQPENKK
ncbi:MAG: DoxX family protein [Bacteroidales bacterium]|nr:DoxX family protein [Bacteroidales bacterium]